MSAKTFFKSAWFTCITVLLVISIVAGGLLAILNDVLYVSSNERSGRAVKKIYGQDMDYTAILDVDSDDDNINTSIKYDELGTINKIYSINNQGTTDLLFQTTGEGGYKGGTITVWTRVEINDDKYDIKTVILESYTKQTLMSKLSSSYYQAFCLTDVTKLYEEGKDFTPYANQDGIHNIVSGATKSANAGCNAVNCVIKYLGEK